MKKYTFNYNANKCDLANDIAETVVNELNEGNYSNLEDSIFCEIDSHTIYYDDQWKVLKTYCEPCNADYNYAIECLFNDIYALIEEE